VCAAIFQPTAVLQDFLEANARPACGPDCAFAPGGVDEFVAVAGVLCDLLDAAGAAALEGDDGGLAGEDGFVFEEVEGDLFGSVDKAFDFEEVLARVDFGDAAVVADEEVGVVSDFRLEGLAGGRGWGRCDVPARDVSVWVLVEVVVYRGGGLTPGGSPLYGNCSTWIMSSLFSLRTYFQEMSGMSCSVLPMA
jgi:hypothetical protein